MFVLDGRPLAPDSAFSHNGINYPANWLRLSTWEEKQAIGIQEVPDPPTWDQRFYWGYDSEGHLIPKDHTQLVSTWDQNTNQTAYTLLLPTDWMIVRQVDEGIAIDTETKNWRQAIRLACATKITAIKATTTTDELAAFITGPEYPVWPQLSDATQPYPSWIQVAMTGKWEAPVAKPVEPGEYKWNEEAQQWDLVETVEN